jgi:hypothetical protein
VLHKIFHFAFYTRFPHQTPPLTSNATPASTTTCFTCDHSLRTTFYRPRGHRKYGTVLRLCRSVASGTSVNSLKSLFRWSSMASTDATLPQR